MLAKDSSRRVCTFSERQWFHAAGVRAWGSLGVDVTAMTCHGPTRIEDAVAVDARKSHCLCRSTCYWHWHAVLHLGNTWAAGGQGLAQAHRESLQNSRCKQNLQTTDVAVHLARELNYMDVEESWPACMQDTTWHQKKNSSYEYQPPKKVKNDTF